MIIIRHDVVILQVNLFFRAFEINHYYFTSAQSLTQTGTYTKCYNMNYEVQTDSDVGVMKLIGCKGGTGKGLYSLCRKLEATTRILLCHDEILH
jgi:hypothetical protein